MVAFASVTGGQGFGEPSGRSGRELGPAVKAASGGEGDGWTRFLVRLEEEGPVLAASGRSGRMFLT